MEGDGGEGLRVSPGLPVLRPGTHELPEALPEACGQQAVDDGIDCWAEVEEEPRHYVHVLVDVVHDVCPVADGTPQEALDVEGRPAEPKDGHHDDWIRTEKWVRTTGTMLG